MAMKLVIAILDTTIFLATTVRRYSSLFIVLMTNLATLPQLSGSKASEPRWAAVGALVVEPPKALAAAEATTPRASMMREARLPAELSRSVPCHN